jgi:hypothetical protein
MGVVTGFIAFEINQRHSKMGRGGRRPGAGRKLGSGTRKSREIIGEAAASGKTPLAYMLSVMNDETAPAQRRDDMAKAAAQFVHPRLALMAVTDDKPRTVNNITVEFVAPAGYNVDGAGRIIDCEPLRIETGDESADPAEARPDPLRRKAS